MALTSSFGTAIKPSLYKWGFLSLLVFVVGQQIYWPQEQEYFHLALLFVFMAFNDMRSHELRDLRIDVLFAGIIFLASLTSIVEAVSGVDLSHLYALLLSAGGIVAIKSILDLRVIVARGLKEYIADNHRQIFNKSTKFLQFLLFGVSGIIVVAVAYAVNHIFLFGLFN